MNNANTGKTHSENWRFLFFSPVIGGPLQIKQSLQSFQSFFFQRCYVVWGICIGTNKSYIYKVFIALNVNRLNFYWQSRLKRASGSKEKNAPLGPLQQYTRRLHPEFHLSFYCRSAKRFRNTRAKKDSFVTKKNSENIAPQYVCLWPWCWFSSAATANLSPG